MLRGSDAMSIFSFLLAFQMTCNERGVQESAAIWILHVSIMKTAAAALNAHRRLSNSSQVLNEGKFTSYCQVVIFILPMYAAENIVPETSMDIIEFKKRACQSAGE